ncbi:MAG: hypothetical protein N3G21_03145 [Candidatus Hydrogenedentes bacterium]|nr:hypothetical protein [Candidatus Hydrogenedentota bacterium]
MNTYSPWKSLMWEELYVGGKIVGVVLGICAFVAFSYGILLPKTIVDWQEVDIVCYLLGYATTLLLLLQIANSGDIIVGIPRRTLSLPVSSSLMVTTTLIVRGLLVIVFVLASRFIVASILVYFLSGYRVSNGHNYQYIEMFRSFFSFEFYFFLPLVFPSLIHLGVYLLLQLICWLLVLTPIVVIGVVSLLGLGGLLLLATGKAILIREVISFLSGYSFYLGTQNELGIFRFEGLQVIFFVSLILYILLIWLLSVKVISKIRAGVRGDLSTFSFLGFINILEKLQPKMFLKRFPNSNTAQLWFEVKNNGLLIPICTFVFLILLVIFYTAVMITFNAISSTPQLSSFYSPTSVVLIFPYLALMLSGVVWYLKVNRKIKREFKSGVFQLCNLPITRKERIYAYWLSGNIGLLVTVVFVWAIEFGYLYWLFKSHVIPHPLFADTSEIVSQLPFPNSSSFLLPLLLSTLGFTMLFGLATWLIMFNTSGVLLLSILVLCFIMPSHFVVNMFYPVFSALREVGTPILWILFYGVYLYCMLRFFADLNFAIRARLLQKGETLFLLIAFLIVFAFMVPWYLLGKVSFIMLISTYLFLSAILVSGWLKTLLPAYGYQWFTYLKGGLTSPIIQEVKIEKVSYLFVGYLIPLLFTLLVGISHFGLGINERCLAYFRDNGLSTSLSEINAQYHSLPESENLSKKYFDLIPLARKAGSEEFKYSKECIEKISKELSASSDIECLKSFLNNYYQSFVELSSPIPEIAYKVSKELIYKVNGELISELHSVAESGLERGHYPIDLTQGYSIELPHLAILRDSVRKLSLEAMLSAIEGDYERMVKALRASVSICKSLENEPVYVSQLTNLAMFRIIFESIQWILNYQELPEEVLLRLDETVQRCAIPKERRSLFNTALHSELLMFLSYALEIPLGGSFLGNYYWEEPYVCLVNKDIVDTWSALWDVFYIKDLQQMVAVNLYTLLRKTATEVARAERIEISPKVYLDFYTDHLLREDEKSYLSNTMPPYQFYPLLLVTYPSISRCIDFELRHYTFVNLIRTAIAIERFRIRNGHLPENLKDLVPGYLHEIPRDPYRNGEPLSYTKSKDFSYSVYSVGSDMRDDGGNAKDFRKSFGKMVRGLSSGDYVFFVPPLSVRRESDISSDVPLSRLCKD